MPSNMLDTDVGFPKFTGRETTQDRIAMILNYLFMLREQLQYTLSHLGLENFNDESLTALNSLITDPINAKIEDEEGQIAALTITAEGLASRVEDAEGNISLLQQTADSLTLAIGDADGNISALQQTVNSLELSVYTSNGVSYVGLTKDGVTVYASGTIDMTGLVTFSDLANTGTTTINGDNITTGTITGTSLISQDSDRPYWVPGDNPAVEIQNGRISLGDSLADPSGTQYGAIYAQHGVGYSGVVIDGYPDIWINGNVYINGTLEYQAPQV